MLFDINENSLLDTQKILFGQKNKKTKDKGLICNISWLWEKSPRADFYAPATIIRTGPQMSGLNQ